MTQLFGPQGLFNLGQTLTHVLLIVVVYFLYIDWSAKNATAIPKKPSNTVQGTNFLSTAPPVPLPMNAPPASTFPTVQNTAPFQQQLQQSVVPQPDVPVFEMATPI